VSAAPLKVALVALNRPGYASLALGYLRAFAESYQRLAGKAAFQTLDLASDLDPWWVAYRVLSLAPDVAAFSVTCWNARSVYDACRIVKAARPETFVVLGGPEVSPIAEEVLVAQAAVDAVVRGEGEVTFAELLRAVATGGRVWKVEGVTARRDGEVFSADDRELVADLDSIPSPYVAGVMAPVEGAAYLETYRGCPFKCGYCFEGKGYGKVRSFSKERVAAEIEALAGRAGVKSFSFIDPVFNLNEERLAWLVELLAPHARRGLRLHTVEVDVERVDVDVARMLREAGVASVETGPQSVTARALELCRRRFDADRFAEGVRALKEAGVQVECDLIVGLPGEDVFGFLAGLRSVLALDPGRVQTSTLHVLPGTELWERADELGIAYDADAPHEVVRTADAGFEDLRRAEVLATALSKTYRARHR
jgi:anaerobic magnesium-protoporphyrin IX monomethyl ester cyclase